MFRRYSALTLVVGAAALAGTALRAQETPAPAAGGEEVALVYKFKPGQLQRFRSTTNVDLTLTPQGDAGGGLGPIPMTGKTEMVYSEKVTGASNGTGTLAWKLEAMTMNFNILGSNFGMTRKNGKWVSTLNGQPAPEGVGGPGAGAAAAMQTSATIKRGPRGETSGPGGSTATAGQLLGGAALSSSLLPDRPVKVGVSWETTQMVSPNVPGPAGAAAPAPPIEVKFTHTLKELQKRNGNVHALIESVGSGTAPEGAAGSSASQSITGTSRFDLTRGVLAGGQYQIDLSVKAPIAALNGGAAPGAAGQSVNIDGTLKMTLVEAPPAPAKAKPAPRKKRR
jgi:hypothetical protein